MDMNEIHLTGRLTRDVELKYNEEGRAFVGFTLAVNGMKDKEGRSQVNFLNCYLWGSQAEFFAKYGAKGRRILICRGMLRTCKKAGRDEWTEPDVYLRQCAEF